MLAFIFQKLSGTLDLVVLSKSVEVTVRDETVYLAMLSAVTPTQWVFYIFSVLLHIHIFTDVSIFLAVSCFLTLYRNLGITKSSLCCRGDSKLQFSGSYVTISWEMASEISQMSDSSIVIIQSTVGLYTVATRCHTYFAVTLKCTEDSSLKILRHSLVL